MTASRVNPRLIRRIAAGLCALSVALPTMSAAQLQLRRPTPVIENPTAVAPPAAEKDGSAAPEGSPPAPGGVELAPRPLDQSGITVNRLETVDPDAIGLIGGGRDGLPLDLWRGSDWATVSGLMPRIPAGQSSGTLRDLVRQLLISRASVPAGKPLNESFVAMRVARLLAMGDIANALALLKIAPDARKDEALARTRIEALYFDNNLSDACKEVRNAISSYSGLYWSQAQAFCLALSDQHDRAALIADLLRERADEVEPVFFAAIDVLAGAKTGETPPLKAPAALHLAMMRAAGYKYPEGIVQTQDATVLRTVALAPNADLSTRLVAAEKAHAIGALTAAEVVRIYDGIPFKPAELSAPITTAEESWTPRSRALLIRAAGAQKLPLAKAEVLRRTWELARERDGYAPVAAASLPIVSAIDPSAELIWFAGDAGRVLFQGGAIDRGLAWYAVAATDRERIDEARDAEAALWPLAVLADTLPQDAAPPPAATSPVADGAMPNGADNATTPAENLPVVQPAPVILPVAIAPFDTGRLRAWVRRAPCRRSRCRPARCAGVFLRCSKRPAAPYRRCFGKP